MAKLDASTGGADLAREDGARGARAFALTIGALNAVALVGMLAARVVPGATEWSSTALLVHAVAHVGLPAALYVWIGRASRSVDRLLSGAALLFVGVGGVSAFYDVTMLEPTGFAIRPSWVCVLILVYALLVPAPAWQPAVLVALSAVYLPIAATIGHAFGLYSASAKAVALASVAASIPTWLCGVIGFLLVDRGRRDRARYARAVRDLERLGSYTLQVKLGQGGMGEVWRARHAFLARPAAVKIIRPEVIGGLQGGDTAARARARLALGRFEREAKATAQLTSNHTIRVFDFGRGPNESFFYVMELLDGLDLHSLVGRYGPQPQERVHHILLQACDSLAEAHDRGMVHRDIKPANLFLCRMGKTLDHVKVLDFGLVRSDPGAKPADVDTLPRLTQQGVISGSPGFMSPEQAAGAENLDRRADLYALGCVAYFLLTGSEPFRHENPMMVLMQQISAEPEPMSARNPELRLDPELEALLERLMAKRREDRPGTADEVGEALRAIALPSTWSQAVAARWWHAAKVPPAVIEATFVPPEDVEAGRRLVRKLR